MWSGSAVLVEDRRLGDPFQGVLDRHRQLAVDPLDRHEVLDGGGLAKLQRATVADLMAVDDVDELMAISIKDTLERVTESTILDQYS